jgi:hypothetical protein
MMGIFFLKNSNFIGSPCPLVFSKISLIDEKAMPAELEMRIHH